MNLAAKFVDCLINLAVYLEGAILTNERGDYHELREVFLIRVSKKSGRNRKMTLLQFLNQFSPISDQFPATVHQYRRIHWTISRTASSISLVLFES